MLSHFYVSNQMECDRRIDINLRSSISQLKRLSSLEIFRFFLVKKTSVVVFIILYICWNWKKTNILSHIYSIRTPLQPKRTRKEIWNWILFFINLATVCLVVAETGFSVYLFWFTYAKVKSIYKKKERGEKYKKKGIKNV